MWIIVDTKRYHVKSWELTAAQVALRPPAFTQAMVAAMLTHSSLVMHGGTFHFVEEWCGSLRVFHCVDSLAYMLKWWHAFTRMDGGVRVRKRRVASDAPTRLLS